MDAGLRLKRRPSMTVVAAHHVAGGKIDGAAFGSQAAGHRHLGQGGAVQVVAVTRFAGVFIAFIPFAVTLLTVPAGLGDVVQAVGPVAGCRQASGRMTDGALLDHTGIPLEADGGHIVVGDGVAIGPDGMGAAVTPLAEDTTVPFAESKQALAVLRES